MAPTAVLILTLGKNGEVEQLEYLWRRILRNYSRSQLPAFKYPLVRIRHFYKCANVAAPFKLVKTIGFLDK